MVLKLYRLRNVEISGDDETAPLLFLVHLLVDFEIVGIGDDPL